MASPENRNNVQETKADHSTFQSPLSAEWFASGPRPSRQKRPIWSFDCRRIRAGGAAVMVTAYFTSTLLLASVIDMTRWSSATALV